MFLPAIRPDGAAKHAYGCLIVRVAELRPEGGQATINRPWPGNSDFPYLRAKPRIDLKGNGPFCSLSPGHFPTPITDVP